MNRTRASPGSIVTPRESVRSSARSSNTPAPQLLAHAVGARLDRPIGRPRYMQKIVS